MKLLIVAPRAFALGWSADTPRLFQIAQGLSRLGWQVELLRCRHPEEHQLKEISKAFPGRVITAPFYGPFSRHLNRRGSRRLIRLWWKLRGSGEGDDYPDLVSSRCVSYAKEIGLEKPDVVMGYTGGQLESFVSARSLASHFQCPLVVEFRDPLPHPGNPPLDLHQHELLGNCLQQAALVVTTTDGLRNKIIQEWNCGADKVRTIYSSYEEQLPNQPANKGGEQLVLLHAGALYGGKGRNARSIVKAIAEAASQSPQIQGKVKLRLIGGGEGAEEAVRLAQELKVEWGVEMLPQMSHAKCQAEIDAAHVLVVLKFDNAEYDLQIPGKTFQYLGRAKPVLGLMRQTEAAEILRRSGIGIVCDHSNIQGLSGAIVDLWENRVCLDKKLAPNWDYIRKFSLSAMAENFHQELSALVRSPNAKINGFAQRSPKSAISR